MLILEKKDDICTFQALGASEKTIRQIFLGEGILITGIGTLVGLVLGLILSWIQQAFGIIQMPGNFLVQAYPVEVHLWDICLVSVGVFLISSLLAALPIYGKRLT